MPPLASVTCQPMNTTSADNSDINKDDLNALLYIVVTLLFYSMGIVIGIITYLKREQAEMEEDKMFDLYLSLKREPFNLYKRERVNQMAIYLKQMEEVRQVREKIETWNAEQRLIHGGRPRSSCSTAGGNTPQPFQVDADGNPIVVTDPEHASDSHGASVLLCSFTYGVCKPLLTPESINTRQLFPGVSTTQGSTETDPQTSGACMTSQNTISLEIPSSYKFSDAIPNPIFDDVFSSPAAQNTNNADSIVELQYFQQLEPRRFEPISRTHLTPSTDRITSSSTENTAPQEIKSENLVPRRKSLQLQRQISLDAERQMPGQNDFHNELSAFRDPSCGIIDEECSTSSTSQSVKDTIGGISPSSLNQFNPLVTEPIKLEPDCMLPESFASKSTSSIKPFELQPLQLHNNETSQRAVSTGDVRQKQNENFLSSIPIPCGQSESFLTPDRRRLNSPRYDSWRSRMAHTVDVPDSKSHQYAEPSSSRRPSDRRGIPRRQNRDNERRGALLYTQKSLHHIDNDNPKLSRVKREGLRQQESSDSYSSRTTDVSDLADSPLLQPAFIKGGALSPSQDADLDYSAKASDRHHPRRPPKIGRSRTVDYTKTYNP